MFDRRSIALVDSPIKSSPNLAESLRRLIGEIHVASRCHIVRTVQRTWATLTLSVPESACAIGPPGGRHALVGSHAVNAQVLGEVEAPTVDVQQRHRTMRPMGLWLCLVFFETGDVDAVTRAIACEADLFTRARGWTVVKTRPTHALVDRIGECARALRTCAFEYDVHDGDSHRLIEADAHGRTERSGFLASENTSRRIESTFAFA